MPQTGTKGIVYCMRHDWELLLEQVQLCSGPKDVMIRAEGVERTRRSLEGHEMRRMSFCGVYSSMQEKLMHNVSGDVFWSEGCMTELNSILRFHLVFSYKNGTTWRSFAILVSPVHVLLLRSSVLYQSLCVENMLPFVEGFASQDANV